MALAITATPQVLGQIQQEVKDRRRRSRRGNRGRFMSKAVRERNERIGRPRWQPSHSIGRFAPPRATTRQTAIREDLDDSSGVDAAEWFGHDDGFDLETYKVHEERKWIQKALRGIRRQLRSQDHEVVLEYREVHEEQERQLTVELAEIECDWRRERACVPDIHDRRRDLKQLIRNLESLERSRKRLTRKKRAELAEARIALCVIESLMIAA